jgi:methyl-accepting chemotaxis protein
VKVAERSGQLLGELVPSIRKTTDLVQDVAAASLEQSMGVSQISKAMSQVDSVTQRNATAAEELAATAEEMTSQAEALERLMTFFQINSDEETGGQKQKANAMEKPRASVQAIRSFQKPVAPFVAGQNGGDAGTPLHVVAESEYDFERF